MIIVPAELVSANGSQYNCHLGAIQIINTGTGTDDRGNYKVVLYARNGRRVREAAIDSWPRNAKSAQALVAQAYRVLFP